jgi:hypothetical protein
MVEWYRPWQLVATGLSVIASTLFARRADRRLVEAFKATPGEYFDYSVDDRNIPRRELWIDYVADSGDGFDSTYAVAREVAKQTLELTDPAGTSYTTRRGRILVFGGDLVYPVASRKDYEARLVMPYERALPHSEAPHPDLFAVPGNHDWYDSLVAFTRRFCSKRWFAGWRTHQRVSYFALQLPHDWWLIGTDVQLDADIDADQVDYFKAIAARMTDRARIILCNAEPHWIYQKKYAELDARYAESSLRFLEENVFSRKVFVFLSGDLHHYRHHSDGSRHKIVAGGGGAFLHPTHDADVSTLPGLPQAPDYTLQRSYPEVETSRKLAWQNFRFPWINWRFGLTVAALYLLTCAMTPVDLSGLGLSDIGQAASAVLHAVVGSPATILWLLAATVAVMLCTDTHSKQYRVAGGLGHAIAHFAAVFFIGWGAGWLAGDWPLHLVGVSVIVVAVGWLVSSLVMAAYLVVSLNVFGRHDNAAFSSLAIPDWKNFVRLHIDEHGALWIYPVGIDRVPRRWKPAATGPCFESDDPRSTPPRLIETPIAVELAARDRGYERSA